MLKARDVQEAKARYLPDLAPILFLVYNWAMYVECRCIVASGKKNCNGAMYVDVLLPWARKIATETCVPDIAAILPLIGQM